MKTLLILSLMIPLISCSPFRTIGSGRNDKPDGALVSYEYTYSGTMMYPLRFYCVERNADGVLQLSYSDGDNEITVYRLPEDALAFMDTRVREDRLHRLRISYRPSVPVLDGYMWHVHVCYERSSISSGGDNAWPPKKLNGGISAINGYLQDFVDHATEADVLGHDTHDARYQR